MFFPILARGYISIHRHDSFSHTHAFALATIQFQDAGNFMMDNGGFLGPHALELSLAREGHQNAHHRGEGQNTIFSRTRQGYF